MPEITVSREIVVVNPQGFHARPAHLFMKLACQFQADVSIVKENHCINGKSILDLLTLGAGNGTKLTLQAVGSDAQAAVDALVQLVEGGFGEMEGEASPPADNPIADKPSADGASDRPASGAGDGTTLSKPSN